MGRARLGEAKNKSDEGTRLWEGLDWVRPTTKSDGGIRLWGGLCVLRRFVPTMRSATLLSGTSDTLV